jgi:hypothetical protein
MKSSYIMYGDCRFGYENFEIAVRTLAAPPRVQASVYPPFADITFELVDDFGKATDYDGYFEYETTLSVSHRNAVNALKNTIENLEDDDWDWTPDNIEQVLSRPTWNEIRSRAKELLDIFGIELGEVPGSVKTASGVWYRGYCYTGKEQVS